MFEVFLYNFGYIPVGGKYYSFHAAKNAGMDTGFDYIIYCNGNAYYSGGPFRGYYI